MSPRFIRQFLAVLLLAASTTMPAFVQAAAFYYTTATEALAACNAAKLNPNYSGSFCQGYSSTKNYGLIGTIGQTYHRYYWSGCPLDQVSTGPGGLCEDRPPPPECPGGGTWDTFLDPPRCSYPQDDACGSIGAHWDPSASSCQCDSQTDAIVTAAGVTRCMKLRDDSCTKDSPDFKGYASSGDSAGQAICDGRASCPDGGTPGYVGAGDTMSAICYSNPVAETPDCDGTPGVMNGVKVCVPHPGKDPDFPDCSGVVGKINGVKQCIHKPTDHPGCKKGETAGYAGTGANQQFTCVPADYKPETCPPGQYITNAATGGFGCAKAEGQQKPDAEGNVPGKATGTPGKSTGSSTTTTKDADGNVTGTEESDIKLDFTDLLQDQPNTDFKSELDEFSDSELDGIDTDSLVDSFSGTDGAFTERNSLTNLSSFVKAHTIGNNTSCSGSLPFFGRVITCDKFATYNRIIGWMIFIYTLISIYNTVMRKSESGV